MMRYPYEDAKADPDQNLQKSSGRFCGCGAAAARLEVRKTEGQRIVNCSLSAVDARAYELNIFAIAI